MVGFSDFVQQYGMWCIGADWSAWSECERLTPWDVAVLAIGECVV